MGVPPRLMMMMRASRLCVVVVIFLLSIIRGDDTACNPQQLPSGEITVLSTTNATFGPHERNWHVYVPAVYDNSKEVPLLLIFHGLNGNCASFIKNTHFMPYAERDNFILISVCGTLGNNGIGFNAGRCCGFPADSTTDDIAFASWIVYNISTLLCINPQQVFISGFSNGAFMTEVVSCNASHVFRAGGSVSGIVELRPGNQGGLAQCDGEYEAPVNAKYFTSMLNVHGTLDPMVPWPGDPIMGFPPVPDDIQRWYDRNECVGNYTVTIQNEHYSNQLYENCTADTEVELVIHYDGTHEWPEDKYFNTTDYIMQFFHRNGMNSDKPRIMK